MKTAALLVLFLATAVFGRQIPFVNHGFNSKQQLISHTVRFDNELLVQIDHPSVEVYQLIESLNLDLWSRDLYSATVHVTSDELQTLKESLPEVNVRIVNENIQQLIDQEADRINSRRLAGNPASASNWFAEYHKYEDIKGWFKQLAHEHPHLMRFVPSIGQSHEGRDIFAIHLTANPKSKQRQQQEAEPTVAGDSGAKKPQIWIQGQIHAREWISGATVQYFVHQLVSRYGKDDRVSSVLENNEIILVPCLNPDGYEYSWTTNRLWRKNRRNNGRLNGFGVDLNRNWDEFWDLDGGSSRSPFSEVYRGPGPASEPEVQALSKYFLKHKRIIGALDMHSFSQLILRPYGHTSGEAPHERQHKAIGDEMRDIIKAVHGRVYTSIPSVDLYPTSGTASDWFYGKQVRETFGRSVYGFTFELRPKSAAGPSGFILPPEEIIPTGEEITPALLRFIEYVNENPL